MVRRDPTGKFFPPFSEFEFRSSLYFQPIVMSLSYYRFILCYILMHSHSITCFHCLHAFSIIFLIITGVGV